MSSSEVELRSGHGGKAPSPCVWEGMVLCIDMRNGIQGTSSEEPGIISSAVATVPVLAEEE